MKRFLQVSWLVLVFAGASPSLLAQDCVNVSTGFDDLSGTVLGDGVPDDNFTVDAGAGPQQAFVLPAGALPAPPWVFNDDRSRWIGFFPTTTMAPPGTYVYEILFDIPPEIDTPKAVVQGSLALDDYSIDVFINGVSTGFHPGGFSAMTPFPPNFGLGLFQTGTNSIQIQVVNAPGTPPADNPSGLRVDACVGVPIVVARPYDVSTGFDRSRQELLPDGASDPAFTVEGPPGSGIGPLPATAVPDDDFPIPPWLPNSITSRWIGLQDPDSNGPAGEYRFRIDVTLPAGFDATKGILKGGLAADDRVSEIIVNGVPLGIKAEGFGALTPFPTEAGRGLFATGVNSIEFIVPNDPLGPMGLRVDGEIVESACPLPPDPLAGLFSIDTGYDQAAGLTIWNALPDDGYLAKPPGGFDLCPDLAVVVNDNAFPIPPWIGTSALSKWIGTQADSNGPAGIYEFTARVFLPDGYDAAQARLIGSWAVDNVGLDVIVNGVPTGIQNMAGFGGLTPFPENAGQGLFAVGENEVRFLVRNDDQGPAGLRVEAVVGLESPRENDLSTGIGPRGIGPLPGGFADFRYVVTGPAGSGIGPGPATLVPEDGFPIPPWLENSTESRWIGIDDGDSVGPAGQYTYDVSFILGPEFNPAKTVLLGSWAASGRGADIILNGNSLGAAAAGPGSLAPFPEQLGFGLFVQGLNELRFAVENEAQGATGLRVEARLGSAASPDLLDISTGFDRIAGQTFGDGVLDEYYGFQDPDLFSDQAVAVPADGYPIPPWIKNTASSRWIGVPAGDSDSKPGLHMFLTVVTIPDDALVGEAVLVGGWAADDEGQDILINGTSTGLRTLGGFLSLTLFPEGFGKGLFQKGDNSIEFLVMNGGTLPNPTGLRVDAAVKVPREVPKDLFVRGDADASGKIDISDPIYGLQFLFMGGPAPTCLDALDADDSGKLDISDPIYILTFQFVGGPEPRAPYPACGVDPGGDADGIDCGSFAKCQ